MPTPDHDVRAARFREWLRTGMWFIPMLWAAGAIVAAVAVTGLDHRLGGNDPSWLTFGRGVDSARQVLGVIAGSSIAFTGTVFSITIVALQLASTQFSPRVLRTFLRDRATQHCLGTFVATSLYSLMVLREVGEEGTRIPVPGLAITGAFLLVVASVFAFVFLVHHVSHSVRAATVIDRIAAEARHAIRDNAYIGATDALAGARIPDGLDRRVLFLERGPGDVVGVDEDDLVAVARRYDCVIEILPDIGDYVPSNAPLVAVHGGAPENDAALLRAVLGHVGIGPERTFVQDPAYGLRQLVDIANRALSAAINDPTTAVQCIDRLHDLLRRIAVLPIHSGRFGGATGDLRLVMPIRSWDDYVILAFEEIRHYGIGNIQIPRRMRAALVDLKSVAPPERQAALDRQLVALDDDVARTFPVEVERLLAMQPDAQGLR